MEVDTRFGTLEIDPDTLIEFPRGLPGLEGLDRFKLLHEEGHPTLFWLQSVDDPAVQLTVADPERFRVRYQIALSDEEAALLGLERPEDVQILVALYRSGEDTEAGPVRANFLGPILINPGTRTGYQKLLNKVEGYVNIQAA